MLGWIDRSAMAGPPPAYREAEQPSPPCLDDTAVQKRAIPVRPVSSSGAPLVGNKGHLGPHVPAGIAGGMRRYLCGRALAILGRIFAAR